MNTIEVKCRAKLNLSLDIIGIREDGYHLMDMVMQSVDLADTLFFKKTDKNEIEIVSATGDVPENEDNLVYRAAKLLKERYKIADGVKIEIQKRIPLNSGLGGGSADAAGTIVSLAKLWEIDVQEDVLFEIGLMLGADIPFCMRGGTARVGGIGERINNLKPLVNIPTVILMPSTGISTREAFKRIDRLRDYDRPNTEILISAIESKNIKVISNNLINVFKTSGLSPQSDRPIELLINHGAMGASMSGSGSAVFGIFDSKESALSALRRVEDKYVGFLTRFVDSGLSLKIK
ncbi:MAG: 4-(cytidine 5'-diphospho)-2-C-methyl-D-erythritol kinase [Ruminococcaceae bacterium]|nr:4-(cytidine 5'-diphospho)-2-C-methyl-D-erythritol kinase [Oscillospiraceae bacterium]